MNKKRYQWLGITMILCFLVAGSAEARSWKDHAAPFDFFFGNHIDTHQQTRLNNDETVFGFLYITYTGEVNDEGVRVAEHCDESTPAAECVPGWTVRGVPGQAEFKFHTTDHPVWLVLSRADIPQPGAYVHFHWLGSPNAPDGLAEGQTYEGYFLELQAIGSFVFLHGGQEIPVRPGLDVSTHVNILGSFSGP